MASYGLILVLWLVVAELTGSRLLPGPYAVANDATLTVPDGGTDLLANDTDPDTTDALTVSEVQGGAGNVGAATLTTAGATVTVAADGSFVYDPSTSATAQALLAGTTLDDTFTYQADDGNGGIDDATATVTVTGIHAADGRRR